MKFIAKILIEIITVCKDNWCHFSFKDEDILKEGYAEEEITDTNEEGLADADRGPQKKIVSSADPLKGFQCLRSALENDIHTCSFTRCGRNKN